MGSWKKTVWRGLQILAAAVIVIAVWQLLSIKGQYRDAEKEYAHVAQQFTKRSEEPNRDGHEQKILPDVDFEGLKEINSDIRGWIYYEGLGISYPVVQGEDNDYYLHHTFEGKKNGSASIFIDMDNSGDFSDYNTFVYGHNMKNGSMFGKLHRLLSDKSIYQEYPYFYLITEAGVSTYEIVTVCQTKADSGIYRFSNTQEEYESYVDSMRAYSILEDGREISTDSRMVTLSTCIGSTGGTGRQIVQGILTGQK